MGEYLGPTGDAGLGPNTGIDERDLHPENFEVPRDDAGVFSGPPGADAEPMWRLNPPEDGTQTLGEELHQRAEAARLALLRLQGK